MDMPHDNPERHSYVLDVDGYTAFAAYRLENDTIIFTHTVVPQAIGGQGVGSRLIAFALADARQRGLRVVAQCAFVAAYITKHPEEADLLA